MESVRGQLLVAGPALLDPNFWRTVVLVVEHTEEGALGLVLNRPSETSVGEAVPQLGNLLCEFDFTQSPVPSLVQSPCPTGIDTTYSEAGACQP